MVAEYSETTRQVPWGTFDKVFKKMDGVFEEIGTLFEEVFPSRK